MVWSGFKSSHCCRRGVHSFSLHCGRGHSQFELAGYQDFKIIFVGRLELHLNFGLMIVFLLFSIFGSKHETVADLGSRPLDLLGELSNWSRFARAQARTICLCFGFKKIIVTNWLSYSRCRRIYAYCFIEELPCVRCNHWLKSDCLQLVRFSLIGDPCLYSSCDTSRSFTKQALGFAGCLYFLSALGYDHFLGA